MKNKESYEQRLAEFDVLNAKRNVTEGHMQGIES